MQNLPIPKNRLKWVVHLPQNGTIGFDPQPHGLRFVWMAGRRKCLSPAPQLGCGLLQSCCLSQRLPGQCLREGVGLSNIWLWVKNMSPKWNPGKWNQRLKPPVPCWFDFDPYPYGRLVGSWCLVLKGIPRGPQNAAVPFGVHKRGPRIPS